MCLNSIFQQYKAKIQVNLISWFVIALLVVISFYMEYIVSPAKRQFSLSDPSISYPFAEHQRYDDYHLFLTVLVFPYLSMTIITFVDAGSDNFTEFYNTTLSFSLCTALNLFLTAFFKIRLAKLRPDFLARCGTSIASSSASKVLYSESICTAPLGKAILSDGYKSLPSGHSSLSICCMGYFSLWLYNRYAKGKKMSNGLVILACYLPLIIAFDVVTSRISDFRHGYWDVFCGSCLGVFSMYIGISASNTDSKVDVPILPL